MFVGPNAWIKSVQCPSFLLFFHFSVENKNPCNSSYYTKINHTKGYLGGKLSSNLLILIQSSASLLRRYTCCLFFIYFLPPWVPGFFVCSFLPIPLPYFFSTICVFALYGSYYILCNMHFFHFHLSMYNVAYIHPSMFLFSYFNLYLIFLHHLLLSLPGLHICTWLFFKNRNCILIYLMQCNFLLMDKFDSS